MGNLTERLKATSSEIKEISSNDRKIKEKIRFPGNSTV